MKQKLMKIFLVGINEKKSFSEWGHGLVQFQGQTVKVRRVLVFVRQETYNLMMQFS
ncbi:unnamed protein product [Paramecium octaurelia]|uniref:Uncharacterized protein n=1 Tax=Paramecium octaurelia TaxID=43137 RepID=A0A8S1WAU5_PAROT|nr:unnamed protein product [Paramecium octaurelia]